MAEPELETLQFTIGGNQDAVRLDKFLCQQIPGKSRSYIQLLIRGGHVTVNAAQSKPSYTICPADQIAVTLEKRPRALIEPEDIPLDIIYEDESLLVVNKPAGMVVHPAVANWSGTLVNALMHHYHNNLARRGGDDRPGIVHRLDKDTSGLLVVAKTDYVHAQLAKQFADKSAGRLYHALIWGRPRQEALTVSTFLARDDRDRQKMRVYEEDGKWAVTHMRRMRAYGTLASHVELRLETGRTHQIRVHMQHVRHPVVGDGRYGGREANLIGLNQRDLQTGKQLLAALPHQALHAKTLQFLHPTSKEEMAFEAPLPATMLEMLDLLEKYDPAD